MAKKLEKAKTVKKKKEPSSDPKPVTKKAVVTNPRADDKRVENLQHAMKE